MTFAEQLATFLSSPGRIYSSIRETILPTVGRSKRRRDESTDADCIELQPRPVRLRSSEQAADKARASPDHRRDDSARIAKEAGATPRPAVQQRPDTHLHFRTPLSTPRALAAYQAGRYGRTPALEHSGAQPPRLHLYSSLAPRRHGPHSSFMASVTPGHQASPSPLVRPGHHAQSLHFYGQPSSRRFQGFCSARCCPAPLVSASKAALVRCVKPRQLSSWL